MEAENEKDRKEKDRRKRAAVSVIAKPLAGKKLSRKTLKVVKRAAQAKQLKRGVKEVLKSVRKGHKGLCIIAGDISPIDVITHVPVLCEEAEISYVYVPSKEDLGAAGATKRPTSCMLVLPPPLTGTFTEEEKAKYAEEYHEVVTEVKQLQAAFFA